MIGRSINRSLSSLRTLPSVGTASKLGAAAVVSFRQGVVGSPSSNVFQSVRSPSSSRCLSMTTVSRDEATGLSALLAQELTYEETEGNANTFEDGEVGGKPDQILDDVKELDWKVKRKAGHNEIVLTRTWGSEKIQILVSISELEETDEFEDQEDKGDEEMDTESSERDEEEPLPDRTIPVIIAITKPGKGSLSIDAVAAGGFFNLQNVAFIPKDEAAVTDSAEQDWSRQSLYGGPSYETLDEEVQVSFEKYMTERGVDSTLAILLPDLVEYYEQQEYLGWLKNVKGFLDA